MNKLYPAPFHVHAHDICAANGRNIASMIHTFGHDIDEKQEREETQTIAQLFAAAPEMLDVLKIWLGAVQNSLALRLALTDLPEGAGPALVEMLQEAIEKAEGE